MVRINLAGRMSVTTPQGAAYEQDLASRQGRLVFAYLTLERAEPVPRDRLASLLWPEALPAAWEKSLVAVISRLRRALSDIGLPNELISSAFGCYQLHLPPDAWVDVEAAEELLAQGLSAAASGNDAAAETAVSAAAAIARGSFLPAEEGDWVDARRGRLRDLLLRSLECRAATAADPATRAQAAEEALAVDPFREPAYRLLMAAHERAGNRAAALRAYERCRIVLAEELGADPSPETESLYLRILRSRTFDALRTNLPLHLPSLVGREAEVHAVIDALAANRLVSLVGVGGSGKTRLALEVAARTADRYADGGWFVELAPLSDPGALAQTVAGVFSLPDQDGRTLEDALAHFLAAREMLIVLDNCEHLIDAAAAFVARVLRDAPATWFLVTSREPLAVAGEVARRLPPLGLPLEAGDVDQIAGADSVRLFVERARALVPAFDVTADNAADVARICTRLEGIPLAIELAAARVSAMDPSAIADRLGDGFRLLRGAGRGAVQRQQTLRATIDWSYKLLSPVERVALERLSVFVGGWTLDAAEGVCADGLDAEVYELLSGLVSKSLVNATETATGMRYGMLETIREYAREKLVDSDDAGAAVERHTAWYGQWSIAAEPRLEGAGQAEWLERVDAEAGNILAALSALLERGDAERAMAVATALWRWWWLRGRWAEGSTWLRVAADAAGWPKDALGARCRWAIAFLDAFRGVPENADELLDEAERIQRDAGDLRGVAYTLWTRGWSSEDRDDKLRIIETALDYGRRSGDGQVTGWSLAALGSWVEDHDDSAPIHREALEIARACGDRWTEAMELNNLGESLYYEGDFASAVPMVERSIEIFREIRDLFGLPEALRSQATIAWLLGDVATVRARIAEARRMVAGTDGEATLLEFLWPALRAELEAGNLEDAQRIAGEAEAVALRVHQRWIIGLFQEMVRLAAGGPDRVAPDEDQLLAGARPSHPDARRSRLTMVLGANAISAYTAAERAADQGDAARAAELALVAGTLAVLKNPWDAAQVVDLLARLSDDPIRALTLFGAAEAARDVYGGKRLPRLGVICGVASDRARAIVGLQAAEQAFARGRAMSVREALKLDANASWSPQPKTWK